MSNRSVADVKQGFLNLRDDLSHTLGLPTVDMLIDRSITEIRAAHPRLGAVAFDNSVLEVQSLDVALADATLEEAQASINALTAVMLLVLARLVGKRVAQKVAEQVKRTDLLQTARL